MNNKLIKVSFGIIGLFFILSFVLNLFNALLESPVPPEVVTSIIIGISVYTLIIILRDLELADIKRLKKNGIKFTEPKSIKKYKFSKNFSQLRDSIAIIIGIITTFFSYFLISKYTDKAAEISDKPISANEWGSVVSDSITLMVFGLIIYRYVYEIEDKEEKKISLFNNKIFKKINLSSVFSILFRLISILIKPIIVLLSLSVIFIVIKILLIMEVKMENILSILAIIFSGVISALIYTRTSSNMKVKELEVNSNMKVKELEVKLKLEEKNKWVENINEAHKDYVDSTTNHFRGWDDYAQGSGSSEQGINQTSVSSKAHNSLIFYIYQSEYNLSLVKEADEFMQKHLVALNIHSQMAVDFVNKKIKTEDFIKNSFEEMRKIEGFLGVNHEDFAKKLGKLVQKEKEKMTTEIIDRK